MNLTGLNRKPKNGPNGRLSRFARPKLKGCNSSRIRVWPSRCPTTLEPPLVGGATVSKAAARAWEKEFTKLAVVANRDLSVTTKKIGYTQACSTAGSGGLGVEPEPNDENIAYERYYSHLYVYDAQNH